MNALQKRRTGALVLAVAWLAACLLLTLARGQKRPAEDYAVKLQAAQTLQGWMDDVKRYKLEAGLAITPYDTHQTGMIGDEYTPITTSLGSEEAKRTTANADMAALLVQMLTEAGVETGDTIGAGFSGSFPTMNLALLAACEAMQVKVIYIASLGPTSRNLLFRTWCAACIWRASCKRPRRSSPPAAITTAAEKCLKRTVRPHWRALQATAWPRSCGKKTLRPI